MFPGERDHKSASMRPVLIRIADDFLTMITEKDSK